MGFVNGYVSYEKCTFVLELNVCGSHRRGILPSHLLLNCYGCCAVLVWSVAFTFIISSLCKYDDSNKNDTLLKNNITCEHIWPLLPNTLFLDDLGGLACLRFFFIIFMQCAKKCYLRFGSRFQSSPNFFAFECESIFTHFGTFIVCTWIRLNFVVHLGIRSCGKTKCHSDE